MPTTHTTDRTAAGAQPRNQEKGLFQDVATFEASATASADVIQMVKIAAGVTVTGVQAVTDALGTSVTIAVGDGDAPSYLMAATSAASAGRLNATGFPKTYAAPDTLDVTIGGAAATGTITLIANMTRENVDLT